MAKIKMINMAGEAVKDIKLNDAVFGIAITEGAKAAMHTMVVNHLAAKRQGSQSTLTRSEVKGSTRKIWRQKGTGRARHGHRYAPQFVGGGVAFAPKPRSYRFAVNKKLRALAMRAAFTTKLNEKQLIAIDAFNIEEIKTKAMIETLKNIKAEGKTLIVTLDKNENLIKSAGNIPNVKTAIATSVNVYDILKHDNLVLTEDAIRKFEEVYA